MIFKTSSEEIGLNEAFCSRERARFCRAKWFNSLFVSSDFGSL